MPCSGPPGGTGAKRRTVGVRNSAPDSKGDKRYQFDDPLKPHRPRHARNQCQRHTVPTMRAHRATQSSRNHINSTNAVTRPCWPDSPTGTAHHGAMAESPHVIATE